MWILKILISTINIGLNKLVFLHSALTGLKTNVFIVSADWSRNECFYLHWWRDWRQVFSLSVLTAPETNVSIFTSDRSKNKRFYIQQWQTQKQVFLFSLVTKSIMGILMLHSSNLDPKLFNHSQLYHCCWNLRLIPFPALHRRRRTWPRLLRSQGQSASSAPASVHSTP